MFRGRMKDLLMFEKALTKEELDKVRSETELPGDPVVSSMRTWC